MTAEAAERPTWRDVNIDKLAERLYAATEANLAVLLNENDWLAIAEAAVDELIDRPEREFQARLDAVLADYEQNPSDAEWSAAKGWKDVTANGVPRHVGTWSPAGAGDWLA